MEQDFSKNTSTEQVLKNAFGYWSKTLGYQFLYGLLYLSILMSVIFHFADTLGILEEYMKVIGKMQGGMVLTEEISQDIQKIALHPNFGKLQYIILATMVLLFPLQVGFFKMFRKIDLKEKFTIQDFLSGYTGVNFFIYASFYLFWYMTLQFALRLHLGFGIIWVLVTLFCVPLMFFQNKRIFGSIGMSFKVLKSDFGLVFLGVFVAFFFKLMISFTFIGIPFVIAFSNAMLYAIYQATLSKDER